MSHRKKSQWKLKSTQNRKIRKTLHVKIFRDIHPVQFSYSVVSNSLWPNGLHARPPHPSPTPRVYSNSCPLSWWCQTTISSSVIHFSFCLQSFPPSGSFQWVNSLNQVPKYWSFSFSISPSNEYSELISLRMDWLDLLAVQGLPRVFFNTTVQKDQFFSAQLYLQSNSHPYMTARKS